MLKMRPPRLSSEEEELHELLLPGWNLLIENRARLYIE